MTRFGLRLPDREARLVALAVSYHLARPGSEIDHETLMEYEHGLAEVLPVIDAQIGMDPATVELSALQTVLLSTAFSSVISELKMYSMLDSMSGTSSRPRSTARGFDERLRSLFPEIAEDPSGAAQLAEEMTMLRRQLPIERARDVMAGQRQERQEAAEARRKRWQFWRRGADG